MATKFRVGDGTTGTYSLSGTVTAGDMAWIGADGQGYAIVYLDSGVSGEKVAGGRAGEFKGLTKVTGSPMADGELVYLDTTGNKLTGNATNGQGPIGHALAASTTAQATAHILLGYR